MYSMSIKLPIFNISLFFGLLSTLFLTLYPPRLTPELIAECERVISKTYPACVAFHKPSFVQQLKNGTLESTLVYGLLACAAR